MIKKAFEKLQYHVKHQGSIFNIARNKMPICRFVSILIHITCSGVRENNKNRSGYNVF